MCVVLSFAPKIQLAPYYDRHPSRQPRSTKRKLSAEGKSKAHPFSTTHAGQNEGQLAGWSRRCRPRPALTSSVALGRSLSAAESQLPHLPNGGEIAPDQASPRVPGTKGAQTVTSFPPLPPTPAFLLIAQGRGSPLEPEAASHSRPPASVPGLGFPSGHLHPTGFAERW